MWSIMMIAMMSPSIIPTVLMFATVNKAKKNNNLQYSPTYIFYFGYLASWVLFSIGISIIQYPLHQVSLMNPMMASINGVFSGIVLILAGINDIAGNTGPSTVKMISDNIISMAELAKSNGISVVISSILPAKDFPWSTNMNPPPKILAVNKIIEKYAKDNEMIYLDYYSSMVDNNFALIETYGSDGVHPNKEVYKLMSFLANRAINKILEQRK